MVIVTILVNVAMKVFKSFFVCLELLVAKKDLIRNLGFIGSRILFELDQNMNVQNQCARHCRQSKHAAKQPHSFTMHIAKLAR